MRDFIKELYYGNIDPQARAFRKHSRAERLSQEMSALEEQLTGALADEQKQQFHKFCAAHAELMGIAELDAFVVGFRLGAGCALDTFCSTDAPLEDY